MRGRNFSFSNPRVLTEWKERITRARWGRHSDYSDVERNDHRNWIEVTEFSFDMFLTPGSSSARGSAHTGFGELTVIKQIDRATPYILFYCAAGNYVSEVILDIGRVIDGGFNAFYQYNLTGVFISSVIQTGQAITGSTCNPQLIEEVVFTYNGIEWTYTDIDGSSIHAIWDLLMNSGEID
jgi:type VI secretion system secreted protein Hcp